MFAPIAALRRLVRRFGRAREGVTAIEFGLVATPFFFLIFGLAEVGIVWPLQGCSGAGNKTSWSAI